MRVFKKKNEELIKKIEMNADLRLLLRLIHINTSSKMNSKNLKLDLKIPKDFQDLMNKVIIYYLRYYQVLYYYEDESALYRVQFYDYNQFIIDITKQYGNI